MGILEFLTSWQFVLLFYVGVVLLIYLNRDKFDFEAKFVALLRTGFGLEKIEKIGKKYSTLIQKLGYIGIAVGYLGMLVIAFFIFKGMYDLFFQPSAPATVSPIFPGVKIPGTPIKVPFWHGIISLFLVIVIHEFSHGIVSKAHDLKVESSGFVLFGPLPGAFVEPDEDELEERSGRVQNSVFAAGPFSNILTALTLILLFTVVINPVLTDAYPPQGFKFTKIENGTPAERAGLKADVTYTRVNGEEIKRAQKFFTSLEGLKPNETVTIGNENVTHEVTATTAPDNKEEGYLGVRCCIQKLRGDDSLGYIAITTFIEFLNWFFILSLGLGLANLLPIGPIDGGRMFHIAATRFWGEERGEEIWKKVSTVFLFLIVVLLIVPIIQAVLPF